MFNILVVEDDKELNQLFCTVLADNGYHAIPAYNGAQALDLLDRKYVDLIISDVMMPTINGIELIRSLRDVGNELPILIITARQTLTDKQEGFRAGTDDYMVKPVDLEEMVWRVQALLRRSKIANERKVTIGATVLDCDSLTVTFDTTAVTLPQKEFFVLFKLVSSPNRIFTRYQIMDEVWGLDCETDTHTLDVHIGRLRERFRDNPDFEIVTVRGLGYKAVTKHA